ncbi:MAG TPA: 4-hydroxy-tetrahydrodipicolinate reductase [Pantanalinema sp.]
MQQRIRVAIAGAAGKMGLETVRTVALQDDMELVGAVDPNREGEDIGTIAAGTPMHVACVASIEDLSEARPDVLVDFTTPSVVKANAMRALSMGMRPVVGTTGMSTSDLQDLDDAAQARGLGLLVAPNFAIGAILLMKFAQQAARYFGNAEIIELHHNRKADAPSGTAIKTAQMMRDERDAFGLDDAPETEKLVGARGADFGGIHIHSVRLPGLVAHQEVIFGGVGQTLTIRHDSLTRESFMPGVMLAIRKAPELKGLVYGLENLL